jgi:hypothetical protein
MPVIYNKAVPDVSQLEFSAVTPNKRGSNSVYVTYGSGRISVQGIAVEDPPYTAPFGITAFADDGNSMARKNLDLSINCPNALKFWTAVDEQIIAAAIANRETWFRVALTPEQIRKNYSPLVIFDLDNKGYAPRLHTKVTVSGTDASNVLRVFNYDVRKNTVCPATAMDVRVRSKGVPIIDMGSIFFMGATKFGLTLYTTDFLLFPDRTRGEVDHAFPAQSARPMFNGATLTDADQLVAPKLAAVVAGLDKLKVSPVLKTAQKSNVVYVNDASGGKIRFQLGEVDVAPDAGFRVPFGIKSFQDEVTSRPNLHVAVTDPELLGMLEKLDEFVVAQAMLNCTTWFKRVSAEEVPMMYRPILNVHAQASYPSFINCKVDLRTSGPDAFKCLMYNRSTNAISTIPNASKDHVPAGTRGYPIITVGGIWFMSGRFGLSLNINDFLITDCANSGSSSGFDFGAGLQPTFQADDVATAPDALTHADNFMSSSSMELPPPLENLFGVSTGEENPLTTQGTKRPREK